MQLCFENGRYFCHSDFSEKDIPRAAGFRWNPAAKQWESTDSYAARKLLQFATHECKQHLDGLIAEQERTKTLSKAKDLDISLACPDGLAYLPFQRAGIAFCLERPAVLLSDQMGLGKSIQVLGVLNNTTDIQKVLIVCPATIKLNWRNEAKKWLLPALGYDLAVVDSTWSTRDLRAFFLSHERRKLAIVNYDILHRFGEKVAFATAGKKPAETFRFLEGLPLDLIVVDEAQYIRTEGSRRSKAVRGITASKKLLLTGTPIVNRPKELFPLLSYLDPFTWNNFYQYGIKFCNGHQNGYGWDFSGASNLPELHDRLRGSLLLRRLKSEVLQELPAKVRQVIELPANGASAAVEAEQRSYAKRQAQLRDLHVAVELAKAAGDEDIYIQAVRQLKEGITAAFTEMAQLRHDTAMAKLPQVIDHIKACLDEEEKVIVFLWHHDICHALQEALAEYHPATITGETTMPKRQLEVERFQGKKDCRVFLGSITAAGVGITLTAAAHVVFVELDWTPGNLSQSEDRAHRIGQSESVLVQHIVLEGSLDATMARTLIAKQEVIDAALDSTEPFTVEEIDVPVAPVVDAAPDVARPATAHISRNQVEKEAIEIVPAEVLRVHRALQYLAGVCDFAHAKDGQGFNLIDARIGHQLATQDSLSPRQAVLGQKIIQKYHNQLKGMAEV